MYMNELSRTIRRKVCFPTLIIVLQLFFMSTTMAEPLLIKGFLTAGGGILSNKTTNYKQYNRGLTFDSDSIMGLQITASLNEEYQFTTQLLAAGSESTELRMDWGYLSNELTDNLILRLGRLRLPLFLYSESLEIGYAYPWISPPTEVYDKVPFRSFNGIQSYYKQPFDDWEFSLLSYFGSMSEKSDSVAPDSDITAENLFGLSMVWDRDYVTLQMSFHQGKTTFSSKDINSVIDGLKVSFPALAADFELVNKRVRFYQFSAKVNWDKYQFVAERTQSDLERSFSPSYSSWYIMSGYHLYPDVLLHVTYSRLTANINTDLTNRISVGVNPQLDQLAEAVQSVLVNSAGSQNTTLFGMRYDHALGIAYKLELQRIRVHAGKNSVFGKSTAAEGYTDVLTMAVDVVF